MAEKIANKSSLAHGPYSSLFNGKTMHDWYKLSDKTLATKDEINETGLIHCTDIAYEGNRIVEPSKISAGEANTWYYGFTALSLGGQYYYRGGLEIKCQNLKNDVNYPLTDYKLYLNVSTTDFINVSASSSGVSGLGTTFTANKVKGVAVILKTVVYGEDAPAEIPYFGNPTNWSCDVIIPDSTQAFYFGSGSGPGLKGVTITAKSSNVYFNWVNSKYW